jgi:hypothetical protein
MRGVCQPITAGFLGLLLTLAAGAPAVAQEPRSAAERAVYRDYRTDGLIVACDHAEAALAEVLDGIRPRTDRESPDFRPQVRAAMQEHDAGTCGGQPATEDEVAGGAAGGGSATSGAGGAAGSATGGEATGGEGTGSATGGEETGSAPGGEETGSAPGGEETGSAPGGEETGSATGGAGVAGNEESGSAGTAGSGQSGSATGGSSDGSAGGGAGTADSGSATGGDTPTSSTDNTPAAAGDTGGAAGNTVPPTADEVAPVPTDTAIPAATPVHTPAPAAATPAALYRNADDGVPPSLLVLAAVFAAVALMALGVALLSSFAWGERRLARPRRAWREAAFRAGGAWGDFTDWLRLGR